MIKKILAAVVLCALMVTSVVLAVSDSGEPVQFVPLTGTERSHFGFELIEALYQGGNVVLSPVSVEVALSMAADGAKGDTQDEILAALGINATDEIVSSMPEGVHSANAAFTSDNLLLYQEYINRLNDAYSAQWFKIDGNVLENANNWASKNTGGLIDPLLSEKPDSDTGLLLMNAVAMDADWQKPFFESGVEQEMFHAAGGDFPVKMMHQSEFFQYAEKEGTQIVRLPYANSSLSMYVMLPEEGGMQELIRTLAEQGGAFFFEGLDNREVELALPKMDVSDDNSLNDALALLGVETAFGSKADFSGMSTTPMYISEIFQKARIQVDEAGTKAAASTVIAMPMMGMPFTEDGPVEMRVDRPFVFAVADSESGTVCFAGVIENPAGK